MAKFMIKKEPSPEQPLSTATADAREAVATLFAALPARLKRDDVDAPNRLIYKPRPLPLQVYQDAELQSSPAKIKTEPVDEDDAVAAAPALDKVPGVQPQHEKLVGSRHTSGRHGAQKLLPTVRLSSRSVSAPNKKPTITITYPQNNNLVKHSKPQLTRSLSCQHLLSAYTNYTQPVTSMDHSGIGGDDGFGESQEMDLNGFDTYDGVQGLFYIPSAPYAGCMLTVCRSATVRHYAYGRLPETPDRRPEPRIPPSFNLLTL